MELGNIGLEAMTSVMKNNCVLFKQFADIDAFQICVNTNDVDEIVKTVETLSCSFGGKNLEGISVPRCFEIEKDSKDVCDIPVFHNDQHGTDVLVASKLLNALKLTMNCQSKCNIN